MTFGKKVLIAIDLSEVSTEQIKALKHVDFLKHAEVHLVHVFQTSSYGYGVGFGELSIIYPMEVDRKLIEQSVLATLVKLTQETFSPGTKIIPHCLFSDNPKGRFTEYAEEMKADTLVVVARDKHGFFDSSFAQYVNCHSKCNVVVLKP
jgi:nucleotide-binding universal stress UspA family protein